MEFHDLTPEEPVDPAEDAGVEDDEQEDVEVYGLSLAAMRPGAEPDAMFSIVRVRYEESPIPGLSYRGTDNLAAWEIAAMLREALAYVELYLTAEREGE